MDAKQFLLDLADHLESDLIPEGGDFNMRDWGNHTSEHEPSESNYCGTSCCLAGWMALHPKYREMGFAAQWARTKGKYELFAVGKDRYENPSIQAAWIYGKDWGEMAKQAFGKMAGSILTGAFLKTSYSKEEMVRYLRQRARVLEKANF